MPGTANFRTSFTNYSAAPTVSSWLLTPFTEQCTVDESQRRDTEITNCNSLPGAWITKTKFDASGALTARRTLLNSGGTLAISDLLATFAHDAHGNLTAEQYYGGDGDTQALGTDASTPFSPPMNNASPPALIDPQYAITHTLTYTSSALTRDIATYANSVTASDVTYDQSTGLVTDVRDVSGLITHYDYDLLGRVKSAQPPGMLATAYTYFDASVAGSTFTPAKVTAVTNGAASGLGSISKEYQYDAFGRIHRQKSLLDESSWSIVQTEYDALGRKSSISMPEKLAGAESSFSPSHLTTFSAYDAFGRAGTIQAPDGKTTTMTYLGIRSAKRNVNISTSATGTTPSETEEIHDAVGRLYSVSELSGATSSLQTTGVKVTTTYAYDSADHLTRVDASPQSRTFTYDHRGFLTQETHPELGQSGNGSIQYVYSVPNPPGPDLTIGYDARGHSHGKLTGSINGPLDLRFTYDQSERLTAGADTGGTRLLKEYSYWSANDTASPPNLGRGKLHQAISHNHPQSLTGEGVVTETYTYATPSQSGRISKRDTLVENVNGSRTTLQSFTQNFTYDALGSTSQIDYPTCASTATCGGLALTGPSFTHSNGFLTVVSNYAPAITYNADGSVYEITHDAAHGVKDRYTPDTFGMSRPGAISFAAASSCNASAAVSGGGTIAAGQTATIIADLTGTAPWSITWSDGVTQSATQAHWTRSVTPASTTNYTITNVTDATPCTGTSSGVATVTVQSCNATATVSGGGNITAGQTAQIAADLTGTAPWSITWSDGVTQSATQAHWTRSVTPASTTNYTISSVTDATPCTGTSSGVATVTVANLAAPTGLAATTVQPSTLNVAVQWNAVSGAAWYQVERATRITAGDWQPIGGHVTLMSMTDTFPANSIPITYLYRVRAGVTVGGSDSLSGPSTLDYATVATLLFTDEPVAVGLIRNGDIRIKGAHMGELRHAIDAVRAAAGFTTPAFTYGPATGPVTASDNITARQRLDEAVTILIGHGVSYTGETPATNGKIWAYQLQQIRDGVR
jgi:YD repeat-containing protein